MQQRSNGYRLSAPETNLSGSEANMNAGVLKGQWKEIKSEIKAQWGKLTDNDLTEIEGNEEKLLGFLQKIWICQGQSRPGVQEFHETL
jgi:uncharacterized protein YjbJ (UPF0337 family)